jgi:hypothetical protein
MSKRWDGRLFVDRELQLLSQQNGGIQCSIGINCPDSQ